MDHHTLRAVRRRQGVADDDPADKDNDEDTAEDVPSLFPRGAELADIEPFDLLEEDEEDDKEAEEEEDEDDTDEDKALAALFRDRRAPVLLSPSRRAGAIASLPGSW